MPIYVIGTPLFEKMIVELPNGKQFTIIAHECSSQNKYIQSATLNEKPLNKAWLKHADIVNGGVLVFDMGPRPNKKWGIKVVPPSMLLP